MNWLPMVKHSVSGTMVKYEEDMRHKWRTPLEKRRGRVYSTVISGLEKFRKASVRLGFLTLTGSRDSPVDRYNLAVENLGEYGGYSGSRFEDVMGTAGS